jgi:hypothetical protein
MLQTYVYKGGKKIVVMGKTLFKRGDEIQLESLDGVRCPHRFALKSEWYRTPEKKDVRKKIEVGTVEVAKPIVIDKKPEVIKQTNTGGIING